MAGQGLRVGPLFAAGGGIILIWSAITARKWSSVFKSVIKGQDPTKVAPTNLITGAAFYGSGLVGTGSQTLVGGPGGHGFYTHQQLETLWQQAGGSAATANNAACHGDQESGGNPSVTSPNPDGGTNVGLWQLDTPGGKGAGYSVAQLKNPLLNARVAVRTSNNGRDWSAWATPGC
jgi:hypothetical protein